MDASQWIPDQAPETDLQLMPTQRAMEMGLFEIKEASVTHSDGHVTS
ncbi:phage antirepressor KilAC domain-containing protein [Paenibacillus larvae]|nr:phage antirepressor KilAC domain-containing protein [Paenibacillus larvae]MDT2277544.1 phage antirepressor KilAC domain-containing protein [Paenibacillus larvae]